MASSAETTLSKPGRDGSVRSVERALQLVEAFARSRAPLSISDLAERLELPASTVHRLVQTLTSLGYVTQYPASKRYGVGRGLAELNRAMLLKYEYSQHVEAHLKRLVAETGETASLAALYGVSAIYLNQVESPEPMKVTTPVGTLAPLHSSAVGKVFLADFQTELLEDTLRFADFEKSTPKTLTDRAALGRELVSVRKQGYALDDEEFVPGARGIAAPLCGSSGAVVAAIGISGPAVRVTETRLADLAHLVLEVAERFGRQMREP